jgi:protein involved in polysaccharide export with SLBB domain
VAVNGPDAGGVIEPKEIERLQALAKLVRSRNPYTLDRSGALQLPGFPLIPLSGLTEQLATRRIAAEPALSKLQVKLTLLPLEPTGMAALKPYGYDLFESPAGFAVPKDVAVPDNYIVGPGDEFAIQLFGSQNRSLRLTVNRDGQLAFPELGPISVGGRRLSDVQSEIESRISRQMIGVRASVNLGTVRAISVFVVGEVNAPGSYAVSGLSTITSALFASGGVKPIGSLRNIQLKRSGKLIRQLDLYDLLLRGDTANDAHLQSGDVVFVPAVGGTVAVAGEVRRPAIYEIKGPSDPSSLVEMAGGFTPDADSSTGELTRINARQQRVVIDVDFTGYKEALILQNGDKLRVARLRPTIDSGVQVQGEVFHPGAYAWHEGLRLTDVIRSISELKLDADQHYLLIRREQPPDRRIAALSADLAAALHNPESAANVLLEPHDQINVFDLESGRQRILRPLLDELKDQATQAAPAQTVAISGKVKAVGDYPLEINMRVSDLIRAGGSLDDAAYGGSAELSRFVIENGQARRTEVIPVDLAAVLRGDPSADIPLQPYDGLFIKEISGWSEQEQVTLSGEVRFPGNYPIKRGETLKSVIDRAGGLTDLAFVEGGVFTREELQKREQKEIDRLTDQMQNQLAESSLMLSRAGQVGAAQTLSVGQTLLVQLRSAKAVGRLVIDLPAALGATKGSADDIVLKGGDQLIIPKRSQEVTVIGEVQNVTSHLYHPGLTRDEYIGLSGGATRMADQSRTYVVRADGTVVAGANRWRRAGSAAGIHPGDTIVVPLDTERMPALPLWQSVTTILYNIAIAVAAVHSL